MIGWEHTFVHELHHLLDGDRRANRESPRTARRFEDGYRAAEVCDAIIAAADTGQRQSVRYRSLED